MSGYSNLTKSAKNQFSLPTYLKLWFDLPLKIIPVIISSFNSNIPQQSRVAGFRSRTQQKKLGVIIILIYARSVGCPTEHDCLKFNVVVVVGEGIRQLQKIFGHLQRASPVWMYDELAASAAHHVKVSDLRLGFSQTL